MIPNHYASTLSELDLTIVRHIPPGGNWKNIPDWVPSKRIQQIRESFKAGKGSRSTYYGRLHPDFPSYTINTYFTRPGNGCHIHYGFDEGQHRTISQREAARLQSFPDDFIFQGSKTSINTQIGNAVPPLLGYQIAKKIPFKGQYVDLFSGAGGLSLGFVWAGWKPIVANDIDKNCLATYTENIHSNVILGDIREEENFQLIVNECKKARLKNPDMPLFVLGGPPCQGFSTAGNRRSPEDERNWLFKSYVALMKEINPDGFIFENVPGILSMDNGNFFRMIIEELSTVVKNLHVHKLNSVNYGVPQRRERVIIIGDTQELVDSTPPKKITQLRNIKQDVQPEHPPAISVYDALSDLPRLEPNEDGSSKTYLFEPNNPYQQLIRSKINAQQYLDLLALL
ncbi:DNA (cytosine-5-)-methyltransferase [Paenibacillus jamilae]|nr:DNA (cytosine-5-)-methyltransferase [Paenibacillus jamilae]